MFYGVGKETKKNHYESNGIYGGGVGNHDGWRQVDACAEIGQSSWVQKADQFESLYDVYKKKRDRQRKRKRDFFFSRLFIFNIWAIDNTFANMYTTGKYETDVGDHGSP